MARRRPHRSLATALLCSLWLTGRVIADDAESTPPPTATTDPDFPTLSSTTTSSDVPSIPAQFGVGAHGVQAVEGQRSFSSSLSAALSSVALTMTAAAPWATSTTGMAPFKDDDDTLVVHTDGGITYACPKSGDEWTIEDLTDSLSAHTATGAGCYMEYAFQGDGVQIYGATGTDGGVFGCSVSASKRTYDGWWNGYGTTNTYKPYHGSCAMNGLGWDDHTIRLTNSPYQPGKVWFTGLRFSTNKTENPWETHTWEACCAGYTFPEGVATTVDSKASATAAAKPSGGTIAGMSSSTGLFVICGIGAVIILASFLVAAMCCKKRPAADPAQTKTALRKALDSDSSDSAESQPLRRKDRSLGRKKQRGRAETDSSGSSSGSESDGDDEKRRPRRHRRR